MGKAVILAALAIGGYLVYRHFKKLEPRITPVGANTPRIPGSKKYPASYLK